MTGGATAGSSRAYRLDPHTLPARSFSITGGVPAAAFVIDRDRAIVRGSAATMTVPVSAYRGVSVRMESSGDNGEVRAFVELLHHEPSLTLLLAVTDDPFEIEDDWRAWSNALRLPLLVVGQDGSVAEPLANQHRTGVVMARAKPRRRHSYFAARRPRFLTRRKVGHTATPAERVEGREIIARD